MSKYWVVLFSEEILGNIPETFRCLFIRNGYLECQKPCCGRETMIFGEIYFKMLYSSIKDDKRNDIIIMRLTAKKTLELINLTANTEETI